jgi:uncharacterized membrane protein
VTLRDRAIAERPWLLASLLLAGMVHILSVLAMPRLAPNDAFQRLARAGTLDEFRPLRPPAPGDELGPYNDPAVAVGVCRYDLAAGALRVRATLTLDSFVSLSFHGRRGQVFYAMTDKAATRRSFDVVVATAEQLSAIRAKDTDEDPPQDLRLLASARKGFVYARALAPQPSAAQDAAAQIAAISCRIEPIAAR